EHIGVVFLIGRDDVDEDLNLVLEAFGEERPNRAVDDARRENLAVARPAFTLDVAARDLARRVGALAVFDREREEREWTLIGTHRDGGEDHRVAELHEGGTGGLFGHAAGLDDELAARKRLLNALHHCLGAWKELSTNPRGMTIARAATIAPARQCSW